MSRPVTLKVSGYLRGDFENATVTIKAPSTTVEKFIGGEDDEAILCQIIDQLTDTPHQVEWTVMATDAQET